MNIPKFKTNSLSRPARGKSLVVPFKVQSSKFQVYTCRYERYAEIKSFLTTEDVRDVDNADIDIVLLFVSV